METTQRFTHHIFICTNQRVNSYRPSCGEEHGMQLVAAFKTALKEKGILAEVRAQRTGCSDLCEYGPNVVVYPEGVFYGAVTISDVDEIIHSHILSGYPVERLRLRFNTSTTPITVIQNETL